MKKVVQKNIFLFLVVIQTNLLFADNQQGLDPVPNNYTVIDCKLAPITRGSKHQTHPNIPLPGKLNFRGYSTNWGGYAAQTNLSNPTTGSVTVVSGSWIVPSIQRTTQNRFCAIWVGIDGYSSSTVEQIGTEHECINGRLRHYAWFEMYPDYSYMIVGFPVRTGDVISASVTYRGNNVFVMRLYNKTRNVVTTVPTSYTTAAGTKRNSAEWVIEAPYLNGILPLINFGKIYMSSCRATINGRSGKINNPAWKYDSIAMITPTGTYKAIPSSLVNGDLFSMTWRHQ